MDLEREIVGEPLASLRAGGGRDGEDQRRVDGGAGGAREAHHRGEAVTVIIKAAHSLPRSPRLD